jgi:hypothetical protein
VSFLQAVVPTLSGVLQGFMMSGVVGVVCPELQDSLLKAFADVDPPNSRVSAATSKSLEETLLSFSALYQSKDLG